MLFHISEMQKDVLDIVKSASPLHIILALVGYDQHDAFFCILTLKHFIGDHSCFSLFEA